ncbi:MAG: coiled coil domain-containing protein [Nitrospirota bacterium]
MKEKERYIEKISAQLREWSQKIDELEIKARSAKSDIKREFADQISELKTKRSTAERKLQQFKNASSDAWESMKTDMETAWSDLKNAVLKAKDKFDKRKAA